MQLFNMKRHFPLSLVLTFVVIVSSTVVEFDENNWDLMLKDEWMVEFFAPWCPACKSLAPVWKKFAKAAENYDVKVAQIDVTTSPSLSGRFFVTALPTIYHVKNGEFRQYRGSRDIDALTVFIQKKDWEKLQPISAWKKPDTIHMTILSYFFKLSHMLKEINGRLQEEYGLPSWGSYALFAIGTIFVGAILGLMLVCIVDFIFPPKKAMRQSFTEVRDIKDGIEDLAHDEIEDDNQDLPENDEDNDAEDNDSADEQADSEDQNEDDVSTSENEKNSQSDSEKTEGDKAKINKSNDEEITSNAEVRKRKPRKAD